MCIVAHPTQLDKPGGLWYNIPTKMRKWLSGRASPCQGEGREFESRLPLHKLNRSDNGGQLAAVVTLMARVGEEAGAMKLELITRTPAGTAYPTPILFVHGAWHGAWCWEEHFLDFFAERGHRVAALDLRGHGASPLRGRF